MFLCMKPWLEKSHQRYRAKRPDSLPGKGAGVGSLVIAISHTILEKYVQKL